MRVNAKLVDQPQQKILASRTFERVIEVTGPGKDAIVTAFDEALGGVLKQLVPQRAGRSVARAAVRHSSGRTRPCPRWELSGARRGTAWSRQRVKSADQKHPIHRNPGAPP